jgi:hypothetical protein
MFPRKFARFAFPGLAAPVFLLAAVPLSYAQDSRNGWGPLNVFASDYSGASSSSVPAFEIVSLPYSPRAGTRSQADRAVHIAMRVPGNAEVWFEGVKNAAVRRIARIRFASACLCGHLHVSDPDAVGRRGTDHGSKAPGHGSGGRSDPC